MPAGIRTVSFRSFTTCPAPAQAVQGLAITRPAPPQLPHVCATVKKPCWKRTCPRPWQRGQVAGAVPAADPLPPQASQRSWRGICTVVSAPRADSSNVISRS